MGCRRRMRDERFGVAEIVGDGDERKLIGESECRLLAACDFKSNESAAARHLPPDKTGLGMIRPARIANLENVPVAAQKFRDPFSVLRLLADAQGKGFERL